MEVLGILAFVVLFTAFVVVPTQVHKRHHRKEVQRAHEVQEAEELGAHPSLPAHPARPVVDKAETRHTEPQYLVPAPARLVTD